MGELIAIAILFVSVLVLLPKFISKNNYLSSLFWQGTFIRILGTLLYMGYAFYLSDGAVDAFIYDNYAAEFAQYFVKFDFSPFTDPKLWRNGELFYTNFVSYPAAFFMILTLNSLFGIYLLFSLVCFTGLIFLFKSFSHNFYFLNKSRILLLLIAFPALWFWPSTIGKDAFMFLGLGTLCLGISDKKFNYIYILIGLSILYAFRPPTAYIALISIGSLFIFNLNDSFFIRFFKIIIGVIIIIYMADFLVQKWGLEEISNDQLAGFQENVLKNSNYGKGALEEKSGGIASIPSGIVDVLARPFIWEGTNILSLASALEINFVLLILIIKRKSVMHFIRNGLRHRLSTFVLSFLLIYIITVGVFENNIGLIARHRSIMFPFLFLMAYAYDESTKDAYVKYLKKNKFLRQYATA